MRCEHFAQQCFSERYMENCGYPLQNITSAVCYLLLKKNILYDSSVKSEVMQTKEYNFKRG